MTPQEFVERRILTTRYFRNESETLVSMAGVAFKTPSGVCNALLNPNDQNISLMINADSGNGYHLVTYHCFAGLFASRIFKCLDKPWEMYRLHLNVYESDVEPAADYGELLNEQVKGNQTARIYIEHLGPPIAPNCLFTDAIEAEQIEALIQLCPVKLTPNRELYSIGMETSPHPGLLPATEEIMAPYALLPKTPKREYMV